MVSSNISGSILAYPRRLAWPVEPGAFRLFLALLVFVHHFSSFGLGPYAVYVFFMLSGFWVQRMWAGRYQTTRAPYFTYIISRFWRLAPVMILVSAITIPILLLIGIEESRIFGGQFAHLIASSTFFLGYAWLDYLPIGAAWSLDVEMQFYAVSPLLAWLLTKYENRLISLIAAAISAVVSIYFVTPVLLKYLFFFMVGMIAARQNWEPGKQAAFSSAFTVAAILILVTISPWRGVLWGGAEPGPLFAYNPQFNVAMAFLTIPFALHTVYRKSDSTDRMFADLSYVIYLLHWVGMQWFFTINGPFTERLAVAAMCFVMVPLVSWVIWRFFDRPVNRLRAAWVQCRQFAVESVTIVREPAGP